MEKEIFKGDQSNWQYNACLNFSCDDWNLYASGYKRAADLLAEEVLVTGGNKIDSLIYPIFFLYRSYFEVVMKNVIQMGKTLLGKKPDFPKNHDLVKLWKCCLEVIKDFDRKLIDKNREDLEKVSEYINKISEIDQDSTSFRYPQDKKGNKSLSGIVHINLEVFYSETKGICELLDGVSATFSVYLQEYKEGYEDP